MEGGSKYSQRSACKNILCEGEKGEGGTNKNKNLFWLRGEKVLGRERRAGTCLYSRERGERHYP